MKMENEEENYPTEKHEMLLYSISEKQDVMLAFVSDLHIKMDDIQKEYKTFGKINPPCWWSKENEKQWKKADSALINAFSDLDDCATGFQILKDIFVDLNQKVGAVIRYDNTGLDEELEKLDGSINNVLAYLPSMTKELANIADKFAELKLLIHPMLN